MKLLRIIALALFALVANEAFGTTYYIDFANGNDANNGTSKATPWQHAPGMQGCTGTCASTTPQAGDNIILKGGVTWPNSVFCWVPPSPGNSSNQIYIGVDQTWYDSGVCGSSFCRPILDAGGVLISGGDIYNRNKNLMLNLGNANYLTLDNLEFKGFYWDNTYTGDGKNIMIVMGGAGQHIRNCYFHGWSHAPGSNIYDATGIRGDTHDPTGEVGADVAYCIFDGSEGDQKSLGVVFGGPPNLMYNIVRYVSNAFVGQFSSVHDNLIEYVNNGFSSGSHMNAIESNTDQESTGGLGLLVYNNLIRHTDTGVVNIWVAPHSGRISWVFNNVLVDTYANIMDVAYCLPQGSCPSGGVVVVNNTTECGPDSNPGDSCTGAGSPVLTDTTRNNHFITSNANPVNQAPSTVYTVSNNVAQSKTTANAQGYTSSQTYAFSPTAGTNSTVGAGLNLTSLCTGSLIALCQDTTYACAYNQVNHTVSCPARTPVARPSSGAWDAGAYQYSSSSANKPEPPSGLTASVH